MKRINVILLLLALQSQIIFSQNEKENSVKFVFLKTNKSEVSLQNSKAKDFLTAQLNIPEGYEFRIRKIKGDSTRKRDKLGYVHERYAQYYKGIKIEYSDIRTHYFNDSLVSINGEYIDVSYIDTTIILSEKDAIERAIAHVGAKKHTWQEIAEQVSNDVSAAGIYILKLYTNQGIITKKIIK